MIILDSLLIGGLRFVLDKVASAVDAEMNDADRLREDLLAAQMQLELGEITGEEFAEIEGDILARMRELRGNAQAAGPVSLTAGGFGVDITVGGDEQSLTGETVTTFDSAAPATGKESGSPATRRS